MIVLLLALTYSGSISFPSISSAAFISSHQKVSSNHIHQQHHVFLSSSITNTNSNVASSGSGTDSNIDDFFIQQVTLKASALDVKVFRGFSKTAGEHVIQQMDLTPPNIISEEEAIDFIMKNYHDNGDYKYNNNPHYGHETYFMAIYDYNNDIESNDDDTQLFTRTNGVVGVVSAQLRKRAPLIAGPSTSDNEDKFNPNVLPAVLLPTPHVYVANMSVDKKMQRKGIAMALLQAVKVYTKSLCEELNEDIPIVLSVDNDNLPAIKLYEKFGFEYLETNDEFRVMIFR